MSYRSFSLLHLASLSNSASAFKYEKREVSDPCIAVKNVTFLVSGQCFLVTCHHIEYHLIEEAKTWDEAQRYCKENYTDLATVSDMTDMKRLREIVNTQEAWIGLQSNPGQTYFHNKEPNDHNNKPENCVQIHNKRLNDATCDKKNKFICFNGKKPTFFVVSQKMH
uniref:C-type lectin domain-containing protein n=1 Tax=Labrus bergylta TaxID=56723 RepID=A0A3Q3FP74_9LABR